MSSRKMTLFYRGLEHPRDRVCRGHACNAVPRVNTFAIQPLDSSLCKFWLVNSCLQPIPAPTLQNTHQRDYDATAGVTAWGIASNYTAARYYPCRAVLAWTCVHMTPFT